MGSREIVAQCHIIFHPPQSEDGGERIFLRRAPCPQLMQDQEFVNFASNTFEALGVKHTSWYQYAKRKFTQAIPLQAESACMQDVNCSFNPDKDPEELKKAQEDISQLDAGIVTGWVRVYHVEVPDPEPRYIPSRDHPANDFIFRGPDYSYTEFDIYNKNAQRQRAAAYDVRYDAKAVQEIHFWGQGENTFRFEDNYFIYDKIIWHPHKVFALKSFCEAFPKNIEAALKILEKDHPDLPASALRAWFYSTLFSEGQALSYVDNVQDFAAASYADSPFADRIKDHILKARQTLRVGDIEQGITLEERVAAIPVVGENAWRVASRQKEVPLENQGYGMFQIIPGQVYDVAKHVDWSKYEGILSKEEIINEDGSMNLKGILRAIYDPTKMFALQVLRFSETLKLIKKHNPELETPLYKSPFLKDVQARKTVALIMTAQLLIAFPERARAGDEFIYNVIGPTKNFVNGLARLYVAAEIMGLKLDIPGIEVAQKDSCDNDDFAWYEHGLEEGVRFCVSTSGD